MRAPPAPTEKRTRRWRSISHLISANRFLPLVEPTRFAHAPVKCATSGSEGLLRWPLLYMFTATIPHRHAFIDPGCCREPFSVRMSRPGRQSSPVSLSHCTIFRVRSRPSSCCGSLLTRRRGIVLVKFLVRHPLLAMLSHIHLLELAQHLGSRLVQIRRTRILSPTSSTEIGATNGYAFE